MLLLRADMFGVIPGRGSPLDVLVPTAAAPSDPDRAAAHAGAGSPAAADETVLVTAVCRRSRSFTPRVFGSAGETPHVAHSMAGAAAALVTAGLLDPGSVTVDGPSGACTLWTDGRAVRVPFRGPAVHEPAPDAAAHGHPGAHRVGVGRGFLCADVDDDPLRLRAPDPALMDRLGHTDLTLVHRPRAGELRARVFAPGFGMPEDAGCLPVAAALTVAAGTAASCPASPAPVTVRQVARRGTESVLTGTGTVRDGIADLLVTGAVTVTGSTVPPPTER